jgi:hypothetical protein
MKARHLAIIGAGTLALAACATTKDEPIAPAAPIGPGAIAGTVAADRDGDGIVDGYYSNGIYSAFQAPPCPPPPPPPPSRRGERG